VLPPDPGTSHLRSCQVILPGNATQESPRTGNSSYVVLLVHVT
jgi:hypothetical protein